MGIEDVLIVRKVVEFGLLSVGIPYQTIMNLPDNEVYQYFYIMKEFQELQSAQR